MSAELVATIFPLWLKAFVLTLSLEVPIFVVLGRRFIKTSTNTEIGIPRLVFAGAFGTVLTHPSLWFIWPRVVGDYTAYIVSGELLVAAIETVTFYALARPISLRHAAVVSFTANAVSWGLGVVVNTFLG